MSYISSSEISEIPIWRHHHIIFCDATQTLFHFTSLSLTPLPELNSFWVPGPDSRVYSTPSNSWFYLGEGEGERGVAVSVGPDICRSTCSMFW